MSKQVFHNLAGKVLIASPYSRFNDVFHKSLIYILSHNSDGAIGLIVNHLMSRMSLKSLFNAAKISDQDLFIQDSFLPVYLGGPVEIERGFFLHSSEYNTNLLFQFHNGLAVSSSGDILKDIAVDKGPKNCLFIVGYTGWIAGQLEVELKNNFWLASECSPELIFSETNDQKWHAALKRLGVDDAHFIADIGHC